MTKLCIACGVEFEKKRKDQNSCSNKCKRKVWKLLNKSYVLEKQREWFKRKRIENPERFRWFVKDRRHRMRVATDGASDRNFSSVFTLKDWENIKDRFSRKCAHCNKHETEVKLTVDHIIPISKGGKHSLDNVQPLCASCNSRKKDKLDFYPARNAGTVV